MSLYLNVDIDAGTHVNDAAKELADLAERLGINIQATFNGVLMIARPDDNWEDVLRECQRGVARGSTD